MKKTADLTYILGLLKQIGFHSFFTSKIENLSQYTHDK